MKDIIEMAREAGIRDCTCNGTLGCLERFAELVRAAAKAEERERIFQELLRMHENTKGAHNYFLHAVGTIRARSNT
jgi:hypothetical protein